MVAYLPLITVEALTKIPHLPFIPSVFNNQKNMTIVKDFVEIIITKMAIFIDYFFLEDIEVLLTFRYIFLIDNLL